MFYELYYIPFYLENVKDFSPTITGVALMPLTGALLPTSIIIGRIMTKTGRFRWAVWVGWAVIIAGTGLLILLDVHTRTYAWVLIFVVVGLDHGFILMSLNFSIQAMTETHNVAYAAAMYTLTRTFEMCIGVAADGAMFQNQLKKHLSDLALLTTVATDAEGFVAKLQTLPKSSSEYQKYVLAYAKSFENVFKVLTAVAGLTRLLNLLTKHFSMDKKLDSEHVLRQGKKEKSALESS
ncbi:MAG: hypothetical protein ASARMPREDX12_008559 [Alectoria sarmentosa]|nr:MAG: hypothetical protein ASARMPREDX12_008559 [Alectoria sarmentosa]